MRLRLPRALLRSACALLLAGGLLISLGVGTAAADIPLGCRVSPPDAHLVAGRKVSVDYLFGCDNARIGYVKVTLALRRDRAHWSDPVLEWYQFDDFRDPRRAGVNVALHTDGACHPGHKYHGDITINVRYNFAQMETYSLRGKSVSCS